jgi:hypothetical protein
MVRLNIDTRRGPLMVYPPHGRLRYEGIKPPTPDIPDLAWPKGRVGTKHPASLSRIAAPRTLLYYVFLAEGNGNDTFIMVEAIAMIISNRGRFPTCLPSWVSLLKLHLAFILCLPIVLPDRTAVSAFTDCCHHLPPLSYQKIGLP